MIMTDSFNFLIIFTLFSSAKDIKDKHGEHFYVSFSLQLKNLENMENKDIDESFIGKIVSVVEEKAPEI